MQSQFQQEPNETERRYRPETVQKAAALAARLQEEHRSTLSQVEVDEMAAEIGIDPKLMRRALDVVARSEATTVMPVQRRNSLRPIGIACLTSGLFLIFFISLFVLRASSYASSPATVVMTPAPTTSPVSGPVIQNGNFEAGAVTEGSQKIANGSRSLPGWIVDGGGVTRLSGVPSAGNHVLRLGETGRIQQVFRTVPGQIYRVTVSLSGEPGEVGRLHRIQVQAGNSSTTSSVFTEPGTGRSGSWEQAAFSFKAEEVGTNVIIAPGPNDGTGAGKPLIDDVRIEPVGYPQ